MVREQKLMFKTKSTQVFEFLDSVLQTTPMLGDRYKINNLCHEVIEKDYKYSESDSSAYTYEVIVTLKLKEDQCDSVCRSTRKFYQTGSRNHYSYS
ncbi:hypothetical protein LIS04_14 [Listeria phage LIS04]|nr:hypothetical protein LIS04_14 [Listeria phage LIS04]